MPSPMSAIFPRLFARKAVDPEWALRGRCIYYRPPSLAFRHPRLILGAISVWTGFNTYFVLSQYTRVPIADEPSNDDESAEKQTRYEYIPAPWSTRIPQALGTVLIGVALSAVLIFFDSRTPRRLHLLVPRKGSPPSVPTKLMIESVLHPQAVGRVFDINRCSFHNSKKKEELFLRVEGLRGQWMVNTDKVLVPNLALGPDEEKRVASELHKILWDYRSKKDHLTHPLGPTSPLGLYHNFPFEPSVPTSSSSFDRDIELPHREEVNTETIAYPEISNATSPSYLEDIQHQEERATTTTADERDSSTDDVQSTRTLNLSKTDSKKSLPPVPDKQWSHLSHSIKKQLRTLKKKQARQQSLKQEPR